MAKYVASGDVSVHKLYLPEDPENIDPATNDAPSRSVMLTAGESLDESEVPVYVRKAVEAKRHPYPLLRKVEDDEAAQIAQDEAEKRVQAEASLSSSVSVVTAAEQQVSSGPGRIADVPASAVQEGGETQFVSGDNSGNDGGGAPTHETVSVA